MPTPENPAEPEPGHRESTPKVSVTPPHSLEDDDEFHFDLNPHETSASPAFRTSPPVEHAPSSIMNTLDAFSTDDFSFNAQLQPSPESQDMWDTQQELDETLDFIFPNLPSQSAPETEAEHEPEIEIGELTPLEIAPSSPDTPITIIQKPVEPSVSEEGGFQSGDRVKHPTYGVGVVQKVIPTEESVVLNITFDQVGKRLLDPALSALTRA